MKPSTIKNLIKNTYDRKSDNIDGYEIDPELSGKRVSVYYNKENGKTVVSHRGTSGAADWLNNLAYGVGRYDKTKRLKHAKNIQKQAEDKYGTDNLYNLGHSQSGIINRKVAKNAKASINVNPASMYEKKRKNEINIRTQYDPVSAMNNNIDIQTKSKNIFDVLGNHSVDNLDNIDDNKLIGTGIKKENPWIKFVKTYASKNNISYKEALPLCSKIYKK